MDDVMGNFVRDQIDARLGALFGMIRAQEVEDQVRLLAHVEDRVREETDKLKGSTEEGK